MRLARPFVLLVLSLAVPAADAQGVLGGRVMQAGTDEPLACLGVALVSESERLIGQTRTRRDGTFDLAAPEQPGLYRIYFVGLGLELVDTDTLRLGPTTDFEIPFRIALTRSRGTMTAASLTHAGIDLEPRPTAGRPALRYPAELRENMTEGRVIMGFAIDTAGRVDPRTALVLESAHPLFTASVRSALASLRFSPAQYSGAPQCIFVTQEFQFALQGRRP